VSDNNERGILSLVTVNFFINDSIFCYVNNFVLTCNACVNLWSIRSPVRLLFFITNCTIFQGYFLLLILRAEHVLREIIPSEDVNNSFMRFE